MSAENSQVNEQLDGEIGLIGGGNETAGTPIDEEPQERRENDLETL